MTINPSPKVYDLTGKPTQLVRLYLGLKEKEILPEKPIQKYNGTLSVAGNPSQGYSFALFQRGITVMLMESYSRDFVIPCNPEDKNGQPSRLRLTIHNSYNALEREAEQVIEECLKS